MRKMTRARLEGAVRRAAGRLEPRGATAEELWARPVAPAAGDEWYLEGLAGRTGRGKLKGLVKAAAALAVCAAVCGAVYGMTWTRAAATIYLDVNPSVRLEVDRREKVTRATPGNRDGEVILEDMDLKRADLDVAVNALLGSMVKHGYLTEAQDIVLLSVESPDRERAQALRLRLTGEINACMDTLLGSGAILGQDVEWDETLEKLAKEYGITPGKAALIRKLVAADPGLNYGELAGLSMNELALRLKGQGIDLRDFASYTGRSAWDGPERRGESPSKGDRNDDDNDDDDDDNNDDDDNDDDDNDEDDNDEDDNDEDEDDEDD